jgi:1-deoxy-D-xylulose-5-phosphate reductoisomerase
MKTVSILGSTGSIGKNALDVLSKIKGFKVVALASHSDIKTLIEQVYTYKPKYISVFDEEKNKEIKKLLSSKVKVFPPGIVGLVEMIKKASSDITINSLSGGIGLIPLIAAIESSKRVCVANKEPIVMAGKIINKIAKKNSTEIIPIDSEPSAVFQALLSGRINYLSKVILTASGGPFYRYDGDLSKITPQQAIKHPNWKMGRKISVDSATLMNKGLEAIEIKNLFEIDISKIEILIHPQSIIHSAVEYVDGSVIANMSVPDMRIPIQYSITYPERVVSNVKKLSLSDVSKLEFYKPDFKRFKSISISYYCAKKDGLFPTVLNSSNEKAVEMFLNGKIKFTDIIPIVEKVVELWDKSRSKPSLTIENIIECDEWAKNKALEVSASIIKERL